MKFIVIGFIFIIASCYPNLNKQEPYKISKKTTYIYTNKDMVKIEGGSYEAFIGQDSGKLVKVKPFYMDDSPITNEEFLTFLRMNPKWTKSKISRLYADEDYLKNWTSDFELPKDVSPNSPVTNISWFAANAYAQSVGKRLPTIDEWEFVALADETSKDASNKPEFTDAILKSYQKKGAQKTPIKLEKPNFYGIYDMYGKVWEWTEDFNAVMMSGESRNDSSKNEDLFCAGAAVTTSDLHNYAAFVRYAMRGSLKAKYTVNNLGFRCAKDL